MTRLVIQSIPLTRSNECNMYTYLVLEFHSNQELLPRKDTQECSFCSLYMQECACVKLYLVRSATVIAAGITDKHDETVKAQ